MAPPSPGFHCALVSVDDGGAIVWANGCFIAWSGRSVHELQATPIENMLQRWSRPFTPTDDGWAQGEGIRLDLIGADGARRAVIATRGVCEDPLIRRFDLALLPAAPEDAYESDLGATADEVRALVHETTRLEKEAKDRALFAEQMIGIVSHDLRNPLAAASLGALALSRSSLSAPQERTLGRVSRSIDRATRLVADLLDFTASRVGSGIAVARRDVDWQVLVAEAIDELAMAFPSHIVQAGHLAAGRCAIDPDRVVQVIGNLVANAAAYGDAAAPVLVSSDLNEVSRLATVTVRNRGTPIAPEKLGTLFEPMARATAAGDARSIGLGLYIVSEIAKAHGGAVEVQSDAEAGTVFTVGFRI